MLRPGSCTWIVALWALVPCAAQEVSFTRDVLPLLSDRCFRCHGPDEASREGDLRLDDREDVFRDRGGIAVVVPGAPERSELVRRIEAHDDDQMPPRSSNLALSDDEVGLLRRWIAEGAAWEGHWAFEAPRAPATPPVAGDGWARQPIDAFIAEGLARAGRRPSAEADPAALLRRVTLDLTGLPPTLAELDAFLADPSGEAYAAVVERLLASPSYGERMAWPWLEAGRYADTDGYQGDPTRTAWPWRDWLVRQLNDNRPFDELTVEMLAGDLLPDATDEQRLATGFLRNNAHNGEGGRIAEETRVENVFDRTETVGTVWMGLTLTCARCHDHKYDPISQREYYEMFAFFDQTSETGGGRSGGNLAPTMRFVPGPAERVELAHARAGLAAVEARLFGPRPELDDAQRAFEARELAALQAAGFGAAPTTLGGWERSGPYTGEGGKLFGQAFGPEPGADGAEVVWNPDAELVDGEVLYLPNGVNVFYFRRTLRAPSARRLALSFGSDDAIRVWMGGREVLAKNTQRSVMPDQERVEVDVPAGETELVVKIVNTGGRGGVYFRLVGEAPPGFSFAAAQSLQKPREQRTAAEQRELTARFRRENVEGYAADEAEAAALRQRIAALEQSAVTVSVMDELPADRRRRTPIYGRGDYQAPGAVVTPGTPAVLPELRARGVVPDRLDLARWLVSGSHPLTARVAVNRAWQTFFGRGLVATPEDFGRQGERPSHPELLDWLATRFVDSGWDTKALHRLIVTSATYRQAAVVPPEGVDDPDNVLLGWSPRPRLPAFMLRDQALALSGRLVARTGGAPVRPYQPEGVWAEATFGFIRYQEDQGAALYRRSLYTFWRRIVGPTALFDTASRQECVVRPSLTNTPLHALTTLNEPGFVEAARGLAERAWGAGGDVDARVAWMFRAATGRAIMPGEQRVLARGFARARSRFEAEPDTARALLEVGASRAEATLEPADLAALTLVANTILNLDEVLTRP